MSSPYSLDFDHFVEVFFAALGEVLSAFGLGTQELQATLSADQSAAFESSSRPFQRLRFCEFQVQLVFFVVAGT